MLRDALAAFSRPARGNCVTYRARDTLDSSAYRIGISRPSRNSRGIRVHRRRAGSDRDNRIKGGKGCEERQRDKEKERKRE